MKNIILIGMPGSGKSTLGKLLAEELGYNFVDFDDDIIEPVVGKSVSALAKNMSKDEFKKLEEELCLKTLFSRTVFASSGSLPYSQKSIQHLQKGGLIIYLKVPISEIIERRNLMKTERIVGIQNDDFEKLFHEREALYIESSDIIFSYSGTELQKITYELLKILGHTQKK